MAILREQLAELAHEQWSGWMRYFFSQCDEDSDESIYVSREYVRNLRQLMDTSYSELSEAEKDSDRAEADRVLQIVKARSETGPTIICLCGSTRFSREYQEANLRETLAGNIVLTIGCNMRSDAEFAGKSDDELREIKDDLDCLHLAKIDLADEILVLNVGGYIGESTRREIEYANRHGKPIRWWEPLFQSPFRRGTSCNAGDADASAPER
jgi:hypothetical protein